MNSDMKQAEQDKAARISRLIVAIVTFLGALGMLALLYFPLSRL
ncbi:MAG TPA: hypothetical protein VJ698_14850 [Noviherbaspirillum sp.]|nr:hypothetical protein [Noviherbaspirillum sp.]HJV86746.1 hypothetical protein [Noviherbaspirillum sp.]